MIVEEGDNLITEPGMGSLTNQFRIAKETKVFIGIAVALGQELHFIGNLIYA